MMGPAVGPNVVTAMNTAIARPRDWGVLYKSAQTPPHTVIGEAAPTPDSNRKRTKEANLALMHLLILIERRENTDRA